MEEEEVDGWIAELGVSGGEEVPVVGGVLADVAGFVGGFAGAVAEEVSGVEPEAEVEQADDFSDEAPVAAGTLRAG